MKLGGYSPKPFFPWTESFFLRCPFLSFDYFLTSNFIKKIHKSILARKGKPLSRIQDGQTTVHSQWNHILDIWVTCLGRGVYPEESTLNTGRCCLTCLKLPFFLCSQSIMSWKMGIMIFRTSGCGTSVTPRKGPIIPGIKWILCSPEQQNPIYIRTENKASSPLWLSEILLFLAF